MRPKLSGSALALLAVAALMGGCAPAAEKETEETPAAANARAMNADELAEHQAMSNAFGEAFLAGDAEALGELYTEDAVLLPPDMPVVTGKEDITALFTMFEPVDGFESTVMEGIIMGDTAVVRGTASITVTMDGEPATSEAKYVEVREKQDDGTWLMSWDMFSYDAPPPDASAAE